MCTVLWPPGVNPIAVNKVYHIIYKSLAHTKEIMTSNILLLLVLCFSACFIYVLVITRQPTLDISIPYSAKYCVATAGSRVTGVNYITNCHLQVVIKYFFLKKSPYIVFYLVMLFCAIFPYSKCVLSFSFFIVGFFFAVNFETLYVPPTEVYCFTSQLLCTHFLCWFLMVGNT